MNAPLIQWWRSVVIFVMFAGILLYGLYFIAANDVESFRKKTLDADAYARIDAVNLSSSHGLYFTFVINGDSQLAYVHWRLIPWRTLDVSK
jgi:hypothetical protein